jgi:hypothetical protein
MEKIRKEMNGNFGIIRNCIWLRVFEGHSGGRRKTGRPRKRWLDDIEEALRLMKMKRWRNKTKKKEVWAKIVSEEKALRVLSC